MSVSAGWIFLLFDTPATSSRQAAQFERCEITLTRSSSASVPSMNADNVSFGGHGSGKDLTSIEFDRQGSGNLRKACDALASYSKLRHLLCSKADTSALIIFLCLSKIAG